MTSPRELPSIAEMATKLTGEGKAFEVCQHSLNDIKSVRCGQLVHTEKLGRAVVDIVNYLSGRCLLRPV